MRRRRTYTPGVLARDAELSISTRGDGEVVDLTERAQPVVDEAGARDGLCTVFVAHSTCGVTTIECEPGCNADLNAILEEVAPRDRRWEHNTRNADTNARTRTCAPRCSARR